MPPKRSHAAALRQRLAIALENQRTLQGNKPLHCRQRPGRPTPTRDPDPGTHPHPRLIRLPDLGPRLEMSSAQAATSEVEGKVGTARLTGVLVGQHSTSPTPCPRTLRHPRSGLPLEQISSSYAHADFLQDPENLPGLGRLRVPAHRLHLLGSRVARSAGPRVRPRIHGGSLRPVSRRCGPVSAGERRGAPREVLAGLGDRRRVAVRLGVASGCWRGPSRTATGP